MKFEEKLRQLSNDRPASRRTLPVSIGRLCACAARLALLLLCMVGAVAPALAQTPTLGPIVKIFVGNIRTMDGNNRVVQAVGVDKRGLIVAVGTRADVLDVARRDPRPVEINLKPGQTLLPGFFDAHLHLDALLASYSGLAYLVGPCFPHPYASADTKNCKPYIKEAFGVVKGKLKAEAKKLDAAARKNLNATFIVGLNLDPSRQPYAKEPAISSATFKKRPAFYIEKDLTKNRPVLILDQSGHFGYVNHAAFRALKTVIKAEGKTWPPSPFPEGGEWNRNPACIKKSPTVDTGEIACYTGLLTEQTGYSPFFQAVKNNVFNNRDDRWKNYVGLFGGAFQGVRKTMEALRTAGLTTVTSMADSADEVSAWGRLAKLPGSGTRIVSIVQPRTADQMVDKKLTEKDSKGVPMPIEPACYPTTDGCRLPRDLGVSAIKIVLDGSTQGCTAALQVPVSYQTTTSECSQAEGRSNFNPEQLVVLRNTLKPLWDSGKWRFEIHANGNRAFADALDLFSNLLANQRNDHTATIIHATVISGNGQEAPWERAQSLRKGILLPGKTVPVPNLDLRFSHLIGHVPYWGDVLERQLGKESAQNVAPTGSDLHYGIPFTLHSDATVSVPRPLWFVRQAVTRETWTYPELEPSSMHVLGPEQRITVLEALRAITIRAAEEKELDRWLGSIEVGKVADFVVLSEDPMLYEPGPPTKGDPTKISDIKVVDTYLGGVKTGLR